MTRRRSETRRTAGGEPAVRARGEECLGEGAPGTTDDGAAAVAVATAGEAGRVTTAFPAASTHRGATGGPRPIGGDSPGTARAVPIAQDSGAVEDADADAAEQLGRVLPRRPNVGAD